MADRYKHLDLENYLLTIMNMVITNYLIKQIENNYKNINHNKGCFTLPRLFAWQFD